MRIAKKALSPWNGIDWKAEIPQESNPYDLVEAKVRIVAERMPARYQQAIQMLADGCSPALVNQFVSIGEDVIRRIRSIHPASIARVKENILDNLMESAQVMSERLAREAKDLPTQRLPAALSATIDKAQLLSGGVTQRTETRKVVTREELQALFEALPRAKVIQEGDIEHAKPNND
jgi:hypothetical protein